jgi:hypothetical protein
MVFCATVVLLDIAKEKRGLAALVPDPTAAFGG